MEQKGRAKAEPGHKQPARLSLFNKNRTNCFLLFLKWGDGGGHWSIVHYPSKAPTPAVDAAALSTGMGRGTWVCSVSPCTEHSQAFGHPDTGTAAQVPSEDRTAGHLRCTQALGYLCRTSALALGARNHPERSAGQRHIRLSQPGLPEGGTSELQYC